jgi:lysophospholipase L1-like esterase
MKIKFIVIVSVFANVILICSVILIFYRFREELIQKYIDYRQSADIVMFGDSHVSGVKWNSLIKDYSVKRLGRGRLTTDQLSQLIEQTIDYKPQFVFILCGGNDIGSRCFKVENVISNYMFMADALIENNIQPVFQKLLYQYNNQEFNMIVDSINSGLYGFCKDEKIAFLDITKGMNDSTGLKASLTIDGLHLNEKGYSIWSNCLNEFLSIKK